MDTYRFDWKDIVYGSIEIEAENGMKAEEKLMEMTIEELLKISKLGTDKGNRTIRFVDAGIHFQDMDEDYWNEMKKNL